MSPSQCEPPCHCPNIVGYLGDFVPNAVSSSVKNPGKNLSNCQKEASKEMGPGGYRRFPTEGRFGCFRSSLAIRVLVFHWVGRGFPGLNGDGQGGGDL